MPVSSDLPDSAIKVYANDWVATIIASAPIEGLYAVYATTVGRTEERALAAALYVLNAFAFGRFAVIRCAPEATTEMDFRAKQVVHKGVVRFSYKLEPGEWIAASGAVKAALAPVEAEVTHGR